MNDLQTYLLVGIVALAVGVLIAWLVLRYLVIRTAAPPTILSPQPGDTVGLSFTVSGTYGPPYALVTVTAPCAAATSADPVMSAPGWSVNFTATAPAASCTATAKVPSGGSASVTFTVANPQPVTLNRSVITSLAAAAGGRAKKHVTANGSHNLGATPPPISVCLYRTGAHYGPVNVAFKPHSGQWECPPLEVDAGYTYTVSATWSVGGQTYHTSRVDYA